MPEIKFAITEDGVPTVVRPGDARVGVALAAAPVTVGGVVKTIGEFVIAAAQIGHTAVNDADYTILSSDVQVGVVSLTAPRTLSLPDVDAFPLGQDLVIADESGACSDTLTITIQPGPGTDDIIGGPDGPTSIVLFSPYQSARFRRGAANLWIRL